MLILTGTRTRSENIPTSVGSQEKGGWRETGIIRFAAHLCFCLYMLVPVQKGISKAWQNQFIEERMPWRLIGERGTPGFLNKQKVYERVSSGVHGGLIVLSLDKSERGIAKATLSARFLFVIG